MARKFRGSVAFGALATVGALTLSACSGSAASEADGPVTLTFSQWWQPEAGGALEEAIAAFEDENPEITIELQTGPYGTTKDQLITGAASGTLPDLIGLDGNWVYDLTKQGVLADLDALENDAGTTLTDAIQGVEVDDATRMLNVAYATYVLFVNDTVLADAGVETPATWSEFEAAAAAIKSSNPSVSPTVLPLSLESPVGIKNDVLSWLWAAEGSFRDGDGTDLATPELEEVLNFFAGLNEAGYVAPGFANTKEQDKIEAFSSGQAAMIISATPHVGVIQKSGQVEFSVVPVPTPEGFSGTPGATYGSWGIGVSDSSPHKAEAWKFIEFLLSDEQNAPLAGAAGLYPANPDSTLDVSALDEDAAQAYAIWQAGAPVDEFLGLPSANELQRTLIEQTQRVLTGDIPAIEGLETTQKEWDDIIGNG